MEGKQIPRLRIEPTRYDTDGDAAALLMDAYGVTLDPWQRLVLDCWLGKDKAGNYTAISAGLSVPRQNGKNVIIEAREFYGLVVNGERILHTAHQARTYKKAFRRLEAMFTDKKHPEIMKLVKQIRYGIGEEAIALNNGGLIEYCSRSRQAARGYDGISVVIYDEAQELDDDQAEALMATLAASATGTRQVFYCGTPLTPQSAGTVFKRYRQSCLEAEGDTPNAWHEWSIYADSIDDIDITDRTLWYDANPSLGVPRACALTVEFTVQECNTLSKDGFCRERLGVWFKPVAKSLDLAIPVELWDGRKSTEPKPSGTKEAYGIKFSIDGAEFCLCGAVLDKDNNARITLIDRQPLGNGLTPLANWLNDRYKKASCVVIDGKNGSDVLIDKLTGTWVFKGSIIKPKAENVQTAAALLMNELTEGTVTWYAAQEELRDSAISCIKRQIGAGWGFGGADSAPIEAAALALWGVRTSKRNPQRQMRIDGGLQGGFNTWIL